LVTATGGAVGAAGLVVRIQEQGEGLLTNACGFRNHGGTLLALSGSENEAFAELFGLLDSARGGTPVAW
jgi:hypothetical protein